MPLTLFIAANENGPGGGDNGESSGDNSGDGDGDGAGTGDEAKLEFSQAQLDSLFAQRAKSASSKATADLLAELGIEDITAAKALLAEADKARKEQMTELEQAQEQARQAQEAQAQAEKDAAERERLANERLMQSAVIAEASKTDYKLRPEVLNDLWLFVTGELKEKLIVGDDGQVSGTDEVVKEIIKDRDYWLAEETARPGTTTRQKRQQMQQKAIQSQQQTPPEEHRPLINF
jgi:hypothetical protein